VSEESKQIHLQMIQGVVNRLAGNSFLLKGWSVTLVAGLFSLAAKDTSPTFVYIAYFPCLRFWVLDGYFLSQERQFRELYNEVRLLDPNSIDYSMEPSKSEKSLVSAVFSKTMIAFHGGVLCAVIIAMLTMVFR